MSDFNKYIGPATAEQIERLKQLGINPQRYLSNWSANKLIEIHSPTERQIACLERFGMKPDTPFHRRGASRLIEQEVQRRRLLAPTPRQEQFLLDAVCGNRG